MTVYSITLAKYATELYAPGTAGRWNSQGRFVIYTVGSVALACLENLVHRDAAILQAPYKLMVIEISETVSIQTLEGGDFESDNWISNTGVTRQAGDKWLQLQETCVLKVPSAIIHREFNFLINPSHAHFKQVQLRGVEDFRFDGRLKP